MIIFLHGLDTYSSRQRLKQLVQGFITKYDQQALNIERLDGRELSFEIFLRAISSGGMFTKKRLVVIENLVYDNAKKELVTEIKDYLKGQKISADTILIFYEAKETADWQQEKKWQSNALVKQLKKADKVEEYEALKGMKLVDWTQKQFKKFNGVIDDKAVTTLINLTGGDLWLLASEIHKLCAHQAGQAISEQDVKELVTGKADQDIFHLVDAVASRNQARSIKLFSDQLRSGATVGYLLNLLKKHFNLLLLIKDQQLKNSYQASKKLGVHSYVAQKAIAQSQNFDLQQLKNIYRKLFSIDVSLRESRLNPELFFDLLFVEI